MIYTLTFAPSIDYVINHDQAFDKHGLNRIHDYAFFPGGKGINASVVLQRLGWQNTALTFLGGPSQSMFTSLLDDEKIHLKTWPTHSFTRINVKYNGVDTTFEINGSYPEISEVALKDFCNFIQTITRDDYVLIMGSMPPDLLKKIVKQLSEHQVKFCLDIDHPIVMELLQYQPMIIKPNRSEVKTYLQREINSPKDIYQVLNLLKTKGVTLPIISDGKNGSYLLDNDQLVQVLATNVHPVNPTGAGDTLLASFFAFYFMQHHDLITALKKATAMAVGTVETKWLAQGNDQVKYLPNVQVIAHNVD